MKKLRITKPNPRKGAASILFFLATTFLMVLTIIFFMEGFNLFSKTGKTQIYADLIADGSCFIGDNGWGINKKAAEETKNVLVKTNAEEFGEKGIKLKSYGKSKAFGFLMTDEKGREVDASARKWNDKGSSKHNTVEATAAFEAKMLTQDTQIKVEGKTAWTRIAYSGGMRVVREAYHHTWEYKRSTQTKYVWGGGHQNMDTSCLSTGADCSGFVTAVFRVCGYASIVGNSCTWGLEQCGRLIGGYESLDAARPGDIILYWWTGSAPGESDHVVLYAGKYKGTHYVIECHGGNPAKHGGTKFTYADPGSGPVYGAHINPIGHPNKIMIRRIVTSDAKGEKLEKENKKIAGLTANESLIARRYLELGYSKAAVAGILGNWFQESTVTTEAREQLDNNSRETKGFDQAITNGTIAQKKFHDYGIDRGFTWKETGLPRPEGYGLGQWTTQERRDGLWIAAGKMGSKVNDIYVQMAFADNEMDTFENFDLKAYKEMTDPEEAAVEFYAQFERGGGEGCYEDVDGSLGETRKPRARYVYNALCAGY